MRKMNIIYKLNKMTREEVTKDIVKINSPDILCELPTSFGKSKIALDIIDKRINSKKQFNILVVVPRRVLIQNWMDEFIKWGYNDYLCHTEFVTYVSFPKIVGEWDIVIFDEVHHLSERCIGHLFRIIMHNCIMLSATVNYKLKEKLNNYFKNLYIYRVSTKEAIKNNILPDPKVYLLPLKLDNLKSDFEIVKNKNQKFEIVIPYSQRFQYAKIKNKKIIIKCTQQEYYNYISSMILWYKRKSHLNTFKKAYLRKSGERLKWLSNQKTEYVKELLDYLDSKRTLTFCNSINQTIELGKYCINSKNKQSTINLEDFNNNKIDHITACNMLDEGVNLLNCQIGIYAVLNSSDRIIKQKLGRLLRHPNPIIIIPYYEHTRDEELVNKMIEDYNTDLVEKITDINKIKLI